MATTVIDEIVTIFRINAKPAEEGANDVDRAARRAAEDVAKHAGNIERTAKSAAEGISGMGRAFLGFLGITASAVGLERLIENISKIDAATGRAAQRFGVSVQDLKSFQGAAEALGASAEDVASGLAGMQQSLFAYRQNGTMDQTIQTIARLGLHTEDAAGKAKNATEIWQEFDEQAAKTHMSMTERIEWSRQLGRSPALTMAMEDPRFKEIQTRRAQLNPITDADTETARKWQIALSDMQAASEGLGRSIETKLLPVFGPIIDKLNDWIAANKEWLANDIAKFLDDLIKDLTPIAKLLNGIAQAMGGWETVIKLLVEAWAGMKLLAWGEALIGFALSIGRVTAAFIGLGTAAAEAATAEEAALTAGAGAGVKGAAGAAAGAAAATGGKAAGAVGAAEAGAAEGASVGLLAKIGGAFAMLGTVVSNIIPVARAALITHLVLEAAETQFDFSSWIDKHIPGAAKFDDFMARKTGAGRTYKEQREAAGEPETAPGASAPTAATPAAPRHRMRGDPEPAPAAAAPSAQPAPASPAGPERRSILDRVMGWHHTSATAPVASTAPSGLLAGPGAPPETAPAPPMPETRGDVAAMMQGVQGASGAAPAPSLWHRLVSAFTGATPEASPEAAAASAARGEAPSSQQGPLSGSTDTTTAGTLAPALKDAPSDDAGGGDAGGGGGGTGGGFSILHPSTWLGGGSGGAGAGTPAAPLGLAPVPAGQPPPVIAQLPGDTSSGDYGTRANNPGNMNYASWQKASGRFQYTDPHTGGAHTMAVYNTMEEGVSDTYKLLERNQARHGKTLAGALQGWAENSYTGSLAKSLGIDPNAPFDIASADPKIVAQMLQGQFKREGRRGSRTATEGQILEGISLARGNAQRPGGGLVASVTPPRPTATTPATPPTAPPAPPVPPAQTDGRQANVNAVLQGMRSGSWTPPGVPAITAPPIGAAMSADRQQQAMNTSSSISNDNSSETHVGQIHVHSGATDAAAVAKDIKLQMQKTAFVSHHNTGLA
jgi:hypothetical protein